MRRLVAAMKLSLDGRIEGPAGFAEWVEGWSDDYGLTPQIDACLLGRAMYVGYEQYWTAVQAASGQPLPMTGKLPTAGELEWARALTRLPHYVLSKTLSSAAWPQTRILRGFEEVEALKQQAGKDLYLMGGAALTAGLLDAGLVDELRLIVYPLLAGPGKGLFTTLEQRRPLELRTAKPLPGGKLLLVYQIVN
jgi:dihydrofolate reductase